MSKRRGENVVERGIHELYAEDPIKADKEL